MEDNLADLKIEEIKVFEKDISENIISDEMKNEKVSRDENVLKERFKKYFPVFTESKKIMQEMEKRKIIKEKNLDKNIDNIFDKINETKKLIELAENSKHIPININNDNN